MPISLNDVEQQARMLEPDDRARLVEIMLESLRENSLSEVEAAWQKEIASRVTAYNRGEVRVYDAEEVFAEARRIVQ